MALTPAQSEEIRKQLFAQIQNLPADKKKQAEEQIKNLSEEQLEALLNEQKEANSNPKNNKGIFRLIADKEIKSFIIDENKDCLAVLDIKPISKGHIIIVPKKAVSIAKNFPLSGFTLAKKLTKRLESKLKAQGVEIQTEFKFGEIILNLIPVYDKSVSINSPRTDPKEEELQTVYKLIRIEKKAKVIKIEKKKESRQILKLGKRIP